MKNSILDGAANSAPVQSTSNKPSGSCKESKGYTGPYNSVAYTTTNRKPKKVDIAGESNATYSKGLKKTSDEGLV